MFDKLGYTVELTARTRDGGCDLIALRNDQLGIKTKYVIEAKHYKPENGVGVGIVRQVSAVKQKFGAHHAVLITSSYFTKDAIQENRVFYGLHLTDYDSLLRWLRLTNLETLKGVVSPTNQPSTKQREFIPSLEEKSTDNETRVSGRLKFEGLPSCSVEFAKFRLGPTYPLICS